MARQIRANIELESGKQLTHYKSLEIRQDLFGHHSFEIIVPFEMLEKEDEIFFHQSHKDICGKTVTISFEPVLTKGSYNFQFRGIVTELYLSNLSDLCNVFVIKGYSTTIVLEDSCMRRTFLNKTIQQIFDSVLGPYPRNVIRKKLVARHKDPIKYCVQYDETNFSFLCRLAAEYGEWWFYNGRELVLGQSDTGDETDFIIDGAQSFDMSITLMPAKFSLSSYDYTKDQLYKGGSSAQQVEGLSTFGKFALDGSESLFSQENHLIAELPVYDQHELDELISFRRSCIASNLIVFHGRGEDPELTLSAIVNVSGTRPEKGGRSSKESFGKYRITNIVHSVDAAGNYSNTFRAVPEAVKFPPVNPHVVPPAGRSELATVIDQEDPDKMGRVRVQFNWEGNDNESDWVRVAHFYTGGGDRKGMHFIPEKDAQVVVGYEGGRPERPFILTCLYPKKEGMHTLKNNNDEKFIYTRGGNTIELIDKKEECSIRIGNVNKPDTTITLEFKDSGIISISTGGIIQIDSQDSVTIKAKQKLSLEAMDIEIRATMSAKISSANTELSGDAMATIKAPLVKIN